MPETPSIQLFHGDCLTQMASLPPGSVDAIITDPPYGLSFMGKKWDYDVPSVAICQEALRVLKPGGHLLSFGGSRTYHRMAVNIEDAGFEIRDQIMWIYGSGFPKSHDISKSLDRMAGVERTEGAREWSGGRRTGCIANSPQTNLGTQTLVKYDTPATDAAKQWDGWGTALKPAHEPICMARKPFVGTVASCVMEHGTGAINVDACRVETDDVLSGSGSPPLKYGGRNHCNFHDTSVPRGCHQNAQGRWPANVITDGSEEVLVGFPQTKSGSMRHEVESYEGESMTGFLRGRSGPSNQHGDSGSAARFFYCAKSSKSDRGDGNTHCTVKPTDLMRYLCRLVTPPNGIILDPFMGSGSTGKAAMLEGFRFIGIESEEESFCIAQKRIADAQMRAEEALLTL